MASRTSDFSGCAKLAWWEWEQFKWTRLIQNYIVFSSGCSSSDYSTSCDFSPPASCRTIRHWPSWHDINSVGILSTQVVLENTTFSVRPWQALVFMRPKKMCFFTLMLLPDKQILKSQLEVSVHPDGKLIRCILSSSFSCFCFQICPLLNPFLLFVLWFDRAY